MPKFILEVTEAYRIEASDEEEAMNKLNDANTGELEAYQAAAGWWREVTDVYVEHEETAEDE